MRCLPSSEVRRQRLRDVLLGLLWAARLPDWPGADGQTVDEVLLAYPEAAAAGRVPGLCDLLDRHPELTDELQHLFAPAATSAEQRCHDGQERRTRSQPTPNL